MNDLELLRQYEPALRYTLGEMFFPCSTAEYAEMCSLWMRNPQRETVELVPAGQLNLEKLSAYDDIPQGHTLYMQFVQEPLEGDAYAVWQEEYARSEFQAYGRMARVGLASRLLDALFDLSLLVRGRVPGGTTAAAEINYRQLRALSPEYVYYGRVLRESGYLICHYCYFYPMNDWRATFYGVNNHEADWEQVFVYLEDRGEEAPVPVWVAYSMHDFDGDNLRRRWDDPDLLKEGTHPVVFVGAGSHASYFLQGEYLMNIQPGFIKPIVDVLEKARRLWLLRFGEGDPRELIDIVKSVFSVPYVDYARGDGLQVGGTASAQWTPVLISEETPWVKHYHGLWGLDTSDPLGGERAPAGPMYNRDGSTRKSWHNPLGWVGLHKVPPPSEAFRTMQDHMQELRGKLAEVQQEISTRREDLRKRQSEVSALQHADYLQELYQFRHQRLIENEAELDLLYKRQAQMQETLDACALELANFARGDWGDPQAHLTHIHLPEAPVERLSLVVELWAALSGGLLLLAFSLSILFDPGNWLLRFIVLVAAFSGIEITLRGRLPRLLHTLTLFLALLTVAVLVWEFLPLFTLLGLIAISRLLLKENLKELRYR